MPVTVEGKNQLYSYPLTSTQVLWEIMHTRHNKKIRTSKYSNTSGVVVQPGISALLRLSQEDCKFKANPSYTVKSIPP